MTNEQKTVQRSPEEIQQRFGNVYQNYMRSLQWAWVPDDVRKRLQVAHRDYVNAVKDAFMNMDVSAVDANTLVAISQSMMAAAWMAAAYGADVT